MRFVLLLFLAIPCAAQESAPRPAWQYRDFAPDGAWCWFADPRAVEHDGRTYAGWVTANGSVEVGVLDPATGTILSATIHERFQVDDNVNPGLLFLPDGRLAAFYSRHGGGEMFLRIASSAADVAGWSDERALTLAPGPRPRKTITYPNPILLADEENRIFLFWRGDDWKPNFSLSSDAGAIWSPARSLVRREDAGLSNRPYVKVASDGRRRIHLAFTDGHPRNEPANSIYYLRYEGGALHRADGSTLASLDAVPVEPGDADLVYDARSTGARAWIWDIAEDPAGRPVIVYSRHPSESDHRYHYARWDGARWVDREITAAGRWFPHTRSGQREPEPHYSGGIVLDHDAPSTVFVSRPVNGVFEIERWTTPDGGTTWTTFPVTRGSFHDNVRPVVVRGQTRGPRVLWMHLEGGYNHYTRYASSIKMDLPVEIQSAAVEPAAILSVMERVADWQIAHPARHAPANWTHGALYAGIFSLALISEDSKYLDHLHAVADQCDWKPGPRGYHADDHAVCQTWIDLWLLDPDRDPRKIEATRRLFDGILANPKDDRLRWGTPRVTDKWSWCDSLFMAPPAWARLAAATGDGKYLDFMNRGWWVTTSYLYDLDEHLYFRDSRYFDRREANGEKVFWSRGNGWVLGGLARVLQVLPEDFIDRPRYVRLYRLMAEKIRRVQGQDGLWRSSLLDPESYPAPETSGSGFFCFALAFGVNEGILDRETFEPSIRRAWAGLVRCVAPDGRLGWVQPVGADPRRIRKTDTDVYGVGAFLLAGSEMIRLGSNPKKGTE